jgi:hypothetical protein
MDCFHCDLESILIEVWGRQGGNVKNTAVLWRDVV